MYYRLVNKLSSIETFENFTGFGLYDRRVIDIVKSFNDPYPYFRGVIAEIGLPFKTIPFNQPAAQARDHFEQFLFAIRYGDAGDHQPFEGAAAAGDVLGVCGAPVSAFWPDSAISSTSWCIGTVSRLVWHRW